jgi:hypothetical protein
MTMERRYTIGSFLITVYLVQSFFGNRRKSLILLVILFQLNISSTPSSLCVTYEVSFRQ